MTDRRQTTDPLVEAVARFIDEHKLIAPRAGVVVGVSGGCDSVAALAVMAQLASQPARAYELTVAHLDHALRDESPQDAEFTAELARRWDLRCLVERIDIAALAAERSLSIETAAREARYEFLRRTARDAGAQYAVVAHHADDNAETICHRIFRGSHLRGAGGIRASRALGDSRTMLVRPLLDCRRAEIEAFCKRSGLDWRTDPTNAQNDFTRNFIRNELLPLVRRRINPQADMAIVRLGKAIAQAEDIIAAQTDDIAADCISVDHIRQVAIDLQALGRTDRNLRGWIFRKALELSGIAMRKVSAEHLTGLSALADDNLNAVNLPGDHVARRRGNEILIAAASQPEAPSHGPTPLQINASTVLPSGLEVTCTTTALDTRQFHEHRANPTPGVELIDADKVRGQLVCRTRVDGDRFAPLGLDGSQTVSDFLTNSGIDRQARDAVRCICDDESIVYLAPLRINQRVAITAETKRMIRMEVKAAPRPERT